MGVTAEWTNKVEVADLDKDGHVDILVANGGGYSSAGSAEPSRIWRNLGGWSGGGNHCTEVTQTIAGTFSGRSRFIKAADVDNDGDLDILTGGAYQSQLKLFIQGASFAWTDGSAQLPQVASSAGEAEFGDVDADGDLDIVISEWGTGNPANNTGGRTRLYRNNGSGTFTDETSTAMPTTLVRWSWELALVDVDNDWDLDALIACKSCTGSFLFLNDGSGTFTNAPGVLPQFSNNYDLSPMDIDADGDLDLVTVNDGPEVTEHIFVNNGAGTFTDETASRLTGGANPANADDNLGLWLDYDDDGDADLLFATLGTDRLLDNDGTGKFTVSTGPATPNDTPATLGMALADINEDSRVDIVQGQGEITGQFAEKLQLANTMVALDTHGPAIRVALLNGSIVTARIHDRLGPSHIHDFTKVVVRVGLVETPMKWYGEMLWRAESAITGTVFDVCATDRAGNETCVDSSSTPDDAGVGGDDFPVHDHDDNHGCCDTGGDPRGSLLLVALVGAALTTRRTYRRRAR